MASTYLRKNSPFVWIRMKEPDAEGKLKWVGKPTKYRKDNPGEQQQAREMAKDMTVEDRIAAARPEREHWDSWVDAWMFGRYGHTESGTLGTYRRYWKYLRSWLRSEHLNAPHQLTYPCVLRYKQFREQNGVSINSTINELKLLGVIMGEAIRRGFATSNPCRQMGFKRTPGKSKDPWTDAQVRAVAAVIDQQPDWMQATFILGYYQADRLRQCEVPLKDIDLARLRITYWRSLSGRPLTKGNKPFTQPIARAAVPMLRALIKRRRAGGHRSLCDIPFLASVEWRRFLDGLGFHNISHHGLRATWITHAALSRKSISREEAKAFVNHGSTSVHEIYQRLNADDVAHVADALDLPDLARKPSRRGTKS